MKFFLFCHPERSRRTIRCGELLEPTEKGVKMTDLVHYALPLGFVGRIMNTLIVKNKLKAIFDHRRVMVDQRFNTQNNA